MKTIAESTPRNVVETGNMPGRPRSARVDRAILGAALELFIEHGIAGASIEKIAKRAGVAKTSIYRRWSSREALVAEAIDAARNAAGMSIDVLDRTDPRDLVDLLVTACELITARPEIRNAAARLIGAAPDHPRLIEVYRETYYQPRRRALLRALHRAQAANLLSRTADLEVLADMLVGAMMLRLLPALSADEAAEPRAYVERLLRQAGFAITGPSQRAPQAR